MRILIIKLSSLGDLFHALPAVHDLKTQTDADIDWVTHRAYTDVVRCFDDISRVISFPRQQFLRNAPAFLRDLRVAQYDKIIDLQGLLKSAFVARCARGKTRIGPSFHREGSHLFYNQIAGKRDKTRHAVIENLDVVFHLGLTPGTPAFPVTFPETGFTASRPHLVICPTSRWETKNWPLEHFTTVARHLQKTRGAAITLLGAPADEQHCDIIAEALEGNCSNLAGKTSIVDMGSILKTADLLLSNDSGPVHMAAAIGTPTLVVFGPTDPGRTGPFGNGHRVVQSLYPCQPCMRRRCKRPESPCIQGVSPDEVIREAEAILA